MDLVYLAGAPATGKSSLMAELTRGARRVSRDHVRLLPYDELWAGGRIAGVELGRRRPDFPGTDTLAMSVLPVARRWIGEQFYDIVFGEGDRLANIGFLDAAARAGYQVNLFLLTARMSVLDERCAARGSRQDRAWRMGKVTLGANLSGKAEAAGHRVWHLDAEQPLEKLAAIVREQVPAMEELALALAAGT